MSKYATNNFLQYRLIRSPNLTKTISIAKYYHTNGKGESNYENQQNDHIKSNYRQYLLGGVFIIGGYGLYKYVADRSFSIKPIVLARQINDSNEPNYTFYHHTVRNDLPTYKMNQVSLHCTPENRIWVTYGIGVYDITDFVPKHPGSDKVMLAAGNAIDPFWHIYQQHNNKQILELLETFRIGNLDPADEIGTEDLDDPWANEPKRHPLLKPASQKPFNAEPPAEILVDSYLTPTEFFYVRNHLPVPVIDIKNYELEIEIEGNKKTSVLKYDDLKKFKKHSVTAVIQCSGNRRSEMNEVKMVKGLSWGTAAIGNAEWSGVKLSDVLKKMGVESDEYRHVHFEGLDTDPTATPYAASIPLSKAMDPRGDVLLAYEMNGKPLSRDHGFPIRVIVPGVTGARNVKWLGRIYVSKDECNSHWQQNDYKGFSPSTDWDTVDFKTAPAIQNMPVTSAICMPKKDEKVKIENGCITAKGYAWSGGGNRIVRVDITIDGGNTWHVAELEGDKIAVGKSSLDRDWGWTLWTAKIPVKGKPKSVEIWAKAVDSNYNVQPETFKNTWNLRGVLSNAYHRVKISLE